jgi:hypothetical protein
MEFELDDDALRFPCLLHESIILLKLCESLLATFNVAASGRAFRQTKQGHDKEPLIDCARFARPRGHDR